MRKIVCSIVIFSVLILSLFTSAFAFEEHYAPNMLIPKVVYDGHGYNIPRFTCAKSKEIFGWPIFGQPRGISADVMYRPIESYEFLIVVDNFWHRLIISDHLNDIFTDYGEAGTGIGQFLGPTNIAAMPPHDLYFVSDGSNDRILWVENVAIKYAYTENTLV